MLSDRIGALIREARRQLGISQPELARRSGVSKRLVAELERGQRPNVSLETALQLLSALGVSMRFTAPGGSAVEIREASAAAVERQARAARRRETWSGGHVSLREAGAAPAGGRSMAERVMAVAEISRQAYTVARAARGKSTRPAAASRATRKRAASPRSSS